MIASGKLLQSCLITIIIFIVTKVALRSGCAATHNGICSLFKKKVTNFIITDNVWCDMNS